MPLLCALELLESVSLVFLLANQPSAGGFAKASVCLRVLGSGLVNVLNARVMGGRESRRCYALLPKF